MTPEDWDRLEQAARDARDRSYSPYSHFRVGAALLSANGTVHRGTNVESASYGLTVCAERNALAAAVVEGATELRALVVIGGKSRAVSPCGACRQVLAELAPTIPVRCVSADGIHRFDTTVDALLPGAFEPDDLDFG